MSNACWSALDAGGSALKLQSHCMVTKRDKRHGNDDHPDRNPDPITGAPGSHPVGTGVGAAGGAVAGAAVGGIGGPVGAVVGGVAGAVVGGLIGKGVSEAVDPTEDAYWREEYVRRPYFRQGYAYEDYEPAYRLGYRAYDVHRGSYDDQLDEDLRQHYEGGWRGRSLLDWEEAQPAVRDAYTRRAQVGRQRTSM